MLLHKGIKNKKVGNRLGHVSEALRKLCPVIGHRGGEPEWQPASESSVRYSIMCGVRLQDVNDTGWMNIEHMASNASKVFLNRSCG